MDEFLGRFISLLASILYIALLARVVISWIAPGTTHPAVAVIYQITEPILAPLRRVLPSFGALDLSPMVAILIIGLIQYLV